VKFVGMSICVVAAFCLCGPAAGAASHTEHFLCKRVSGGPMKDLSFTVDYDAGMVSVDGYSYSPDDPSEVKISDSTIEWGFMRGYMSLDRKSGALAWDTTAEKGYLETIGQPTDEPDSDFQGAMHCERVR